MQKPGSYKKIIDELKKTLREKKESLQDVELRTLRKKLKRAQRRRRQAIAEQKRREKASGAGKQEASGGAG